MATLPSLFRRLRNGADPLPSPPAPRRVSAPPGARHCVLLVLDSCRFDSFAAAQPRVMSRLGALQRRYAYATWTAPSHYNLLMGLLPHPSPTQVFASDHYKQDFLAWGSRLGLPDLSFVGMLPRIWLPQYLQSIGYETRALVSMPVLNPDTPLAVNFDQYTLMEKHNDLDAMVERLRFPVDRPSFTLLNAGETHYPYAPIEEPESDWPRVHGVNGVFKRLAAGAPLHQSEAPAFFDQDRLDRLRDRQVAVIQRVDRSVERLLDRVPRGTWVIITADHGELFGEGGYFGHGPILHDKVLEVPFLEGLAR